MRINSIAFVVYMATFLLGHCNLAVSQQTGWNKYFADEVRKIQATTEADLASVTKENWPEKQAAWRTELRTMLGLEPQPDRTGLNVTVTGTIHHTGLNIQRLHYQSRPGLYVAANLYLPRGEAPKSGWPAVLYVCGHAKVESNGRLLGNKTGYHHHGLWFARHGVACLVIDTVQLGELHGEHHGTYKLGRWDWVSRGYTPAGVEAWNAIRGLDVLEAWPGIDGKRMGITGRSGGGAYSWYAAALDDRIRVAVPVAGITDLQNHVIDGCVEGHCDCMYMINYYGWDYAKLAALMAPRPLLLANSDADGIFPLDGVIRTHGAIAKVYANLGAKDNLGLLITPGPHKDTQELQVGAFKWLLTHLVGPDPVIDSAALKELTPEQLAVFDRESPADERVTSTGEWFAPAGAPEHDPNTAAQKWSEDWFPSLKATALRQPLLLASAAHDFALTISGDSKVGNWKLYQSPTDDGNAISILAIESTGKSPAHVHVGALDSIELKADSIERFLESDDVQKLLSTNSTAAHYFIQSRNANWQTQAGNLKNRIQTVRRFYLVGHMPEQLVLSDTLIGLAWLNRSMDVKSVILTGRGRAAPITAVVALLSHNEKSQSVNKRGPEITELQVTSYPSEAELGPSLPGILRVVDFQSLLAAARGQLKVVEMPSTAQQEYEPLVDSATEPQQATGIRIVEVGQTTATVWMRATRWSLPNLGDMAVLKFEKPAATQNMGPLLPSSGVDGLCYGVPGVPAEVRVSYRPFGRGNWVHSEWTKVSVETDFSALVNISKLAGDTEYEVRTAARANGSEVTSTVNGKFRTLPDEVKSSFRLAVGTCQDFPDRDGPHGFDLYRTMLERNTNAFVMAGDVVYYDKLARSVPLAHYHWQRTYGLATLVNFHRQVPTYFLKDDHDTYVNDTWPGTRLKWTEAFTFEDGQRIFRQQTGLPTPAYRTFMIGNELQVWLMEGRDYRSPNNAPDGPEKSIWGSEQKAWLTNTLSQSSAKFKVLISPTPLVGPDRENKHDNHSNAVFATEGNEIRKLLATYPNLVSVCGDRHWQYHSVDPATGLHEFSVGPASERHAGGWDPQEFRKDIHRFLRVAGGYLEIELSGSTQASTLTLRHLDTAGTEQHRHVLK
jgi:PhoD-like phosphatase/Acetyl xylan esterase (AXE1)